MSSDTLIALASILTGIGALAAAVVAAFALRAQERSQQRQHDLENLRWLTSEWANLREMRQRAAKSLLDDDLDEYALREVLNFLESCGFMVRERFITTRTFGETVGGAAVRGWWAAAEPVIQAARARTGHPSLFEQLEWLRGELETDRFDVNEIWVNDFVRREATLPVFAQAEAEA